VGGYAAPVPETPEERAGKPEQDVPKPINWDPSRPVVKKRKRYDLNESQLYNQNEHADNPKILMSLKKLRRTVNAQNPPTYEQLEEGLRKGQINQQEFDEMVQYYGQTPPQQQLPQFPEITPETIEGVSEWEPPTKKPGEPGRTFLGKRK
jgi:hypothetical protein